MEKQRILRTKSIRAPISPEDGMRISVMSRHTLNDGVTPDPLITPGTYDLWMKELAPSDLLIGSYYKRGLPWEEFAKQYLDFLRTPDSTVHIQALIHLIQEQTTTLLCIEETPERCHRRLLAQECQSMDPHLFLSLK
jgi:uncharacterized protein YeaO (DUF488 family)